MTPEYAKLLGMMSTWNDELDATMVIIPYTVHGDWEVEICGYEDYPKLRKLLADEIQDAREHFEQFGEVGPITIALVYYDTLGEIYLYLNGEKWGLLSKDNFS